MIEQEVEKCPCCAATVDPSRSGALTALAFVLIICEAERFQSGKQITAYPGLVPEGESSGERRRRGHISKRQCANVGPKRCMWVGLRSEPDSD